MTPRPTRLAALVSLVAAAGACSNATAPAPSPTPATASPPPRSGEPALAPPPSAPPPLPLASASAAAPPAAPPGMLFVPGGVFVMGTDRGGQEDEKPPHRVGVGPFFLDATEVTNEAYEACVRERGCRPHATNNSQDNHLGDDRLFRHPRQPISGISWDDATHFCQTLGRRLPTEAEWERAARGDDGRRFPWGNEPATRERAVFGEATTADVGSRPKGNGPYGHSDLAGNVWEWVDDFYDPYAYRRAGAAEGKPGTCEEITKAQNELREGGRQGFTGSNPIPVDCEKVLRGGAFNYDGPGLRSSNRVHHPGRFRLVMSGFRCAKDAAGAPPATGSSTSPPAASTPSPPAEH